MILHDDNPCVGRWVEGYLPVYIHRKGYDRPTEFHVRSAGRTVTVYEPIEDVRCVVEFAPDNTVQLVGGGDDNRYMVRAAEHAVEHWLKLSQLRQTAFNPKAAEPQPPLPRARVVDIVSSNQLIVETLDGTTYEVEVHCSVLVLKINRLGCLPHYVQWNGGLQEWELGAGSPRVQLRELQRLQTAAQTAFDYWHKADR